MNSIVKDLLLNCLYFVLVLALIPVCNNTVVVLAILSACIFFIANHMKKYFSLKQELIRQREYFIETLSHDLRVATLAQIRGLDLLDSNESQEELVSDIKDSCKYTLDMITMLLNTYRFENGEEVLNYEKFKLSGIVVKCCRDLIKLAEEKGVTLSYEIENVEKLDADKAGISKLVMCLLSTAIFNSDRNSDVNICVSKLYDNFEVTIKYTGEPLTEEECRRMFSNSPRFSTVGHGIRMHLCKKIVDFHGGDIWVTNNGKTNSFTFILPSTPKRVLLKTPVLSAM